MKSRNITTIITEGTDGVGKSSLIHELFKIYDYRYMVYHRGELSNLFYARKYNRPFSATQVGLPFLHILLTCDKEVLRKRIMSRDYSSEEELNNELAKVDDQDEFIKLYHQMKKNYHMLMLDTTNLTIEEVGKKAAEMIDNYVKSLKDDDNEEMSEWNKQYEKGCEKLGLRFSVKDNQPYINDIAFMSESTLQNGVYETFSDKRYPDNLIFSMAYDIPVVFMPKIFDFAYIINSKIKQRFEVFEYMSNWLKNNKTVLVSESEMMPHIEGLTFSCPRAFGNQFIKQISKAFATVYCARDLAALRLQTARLYEAIIAQQIVFVDKQSDPDCEILKQIHDDKDLIDLLYVTPETISDNYDIIKSDKKMRSKIIKNQSNFYDELLKNNKGGLFNA